MADPTSADGERASRPIPDPQSFTSRHTLSLPDGALDYTAIAEDTFIEGEDGTPQASVFSISYMKNDAPPDRPVTFCFNGGPGSSSMWLHMGGIGPKRVAVPSDAAYAGPPPFPIVDNPLSPLIPSDLVFVDPIGTGYSRALGKAQDEAFWGLHTDAALLVSFVKRWLGHHKRWNAPRYLAGESYGTTRITQMAEKMYDPFEGMGINGLIMISSVLDFHTVRPNPGNILPDLAFLPTYTATAHYHGVLSGDLHEAIAAARAFAREEFAPALLTGRADIAIAGRLAELTGVSADLWRQSRLRMPVTRFRKALLRERGLTVGRLDSRYTGRDVDDAGDGPDIDASAAAIDTAYTAAVRTHLSETLNVAIERPYVGFNREAPQRWDWLGQSTDGPQAIHRQWPSTVNLGPALAKIMAQQPDLTLTIANGLYDLATPFFAAELALATNAIPQERAEMIEYEAGHMMYIHEPSLRRLSSQIIDLVSGNGARP